ncbi:MAG: hypothetical protein KKF56_03035 [Nanoarchaeota archaeon]|nr:hypothetical protein [Nanoarchaeota archaeon]
MTTLVGIKAEKGKEGVVLASDMSRTTEELKGDGDVYYRHLTKRPAQKIWVSDNRRFAVAMSGIVDQLYTQFLREMLQGGFDIEKAVKEGNFPELKKLNDYRWGGMVPDKRMNGLLIASRFRGKPGLYSCWPGGKVEEKGWTSVGSGSDLALAHIDRYNIDNMVGMPTYISLDQAVDLSRECLGKSSEDIYTLGKDVVVVAKDGIHELGGRLEKELEATEDRVFTEFKRKLRKP